jgi:hypothetical protein
VAALKARRYKQLPSKDGSARHFRRDNEDPVTFHEPHGSSTIPQGTLGSYLRKLDLSVDDFLSAVNESSPAEESLEERFRRTLLGDGQTISHCCTCWQPVITALSLDEVSEAETNHICSAAQA